MSPANPYVNDILLWRDSLSRMPDHHFFELLRMYLGDIKTPYNKQKLIEQLSAFLRNEKNRENIALLLSKTDILIIAAINALPQPTQDKLLTFFGEEFSIAELYERVMNLEERLLVFRVYEDGNAQILKVNPLLRPVLDSLLTNEVLISPAQIETNTIKQNSEKISSSLLGAWFSFTAQNPDLCKANHCFKKKTISLIKTVFPLVHNSEFFLYLTMALHNLQLFRLSEGAYKPVIKNWYTFAAMDEESQYAYICAAAYSRSSRDELHTNAQLVCDLLSIMGEKSYTTTVLIRAAYLQLQKKGSVRSGMVRRGRFAAMLQKNAGDSTISSSFAENNASGQGEKSNSKSLQKLISIMRLFGLLECVGTTESGEDIYKRCAFTNKKVQSNSTIAGSVVINAGFSVTLLQDLPLESLLDIIRCMDIQRLDGIAEYKITRSSCMRSYDAGIKPQNIIQALSSAIMHEIPQNLQFSLEEWYANYSSASLYKGYILRVDAEKQILIKNVPEISEHIKEELAPGVYLVDFLSDDEALAVIAKSGLDFIGAVKSHAIQSKPIPFPTIQIREGVQESGVTPAKIDTAEEVVNNSSVFIQATKKNSASFLDSMRNKISKDEIEEEQKDGLLSRISRKIIVNPEQLRPESVRAEKNEASGMDFLGKIHVVEHAILSKSFIKLSVDPVAAVEGDTEILGLPLSVEKKDGDVHVKLQLESSGKIVILSIGQAKKVKRIRGSIFKEREY